MSQVNLVPRSRIVWEEGRESAREVVALGAAAALTALVLDVTITDEIGLVFDVSFVVLCLVLALVVRRLDFFVVGVLPPLLMGGVFMLVSISNPARLGHPEDGMIQATITGLSHHSMALLAGYGLCLLVLFLRQRTISTREAVEGSSRD